MFSKQKVSRAIAILQLFTVAFTQLPLKFDDVSAAITGVSSGTGDSVSNPGLAEDSSDWRRFRPQRRSIRFLLSSRETDSRF